MWCSPKMGVKKCVFGFPSEMHCKLRHEGRIQLKPDMCRTVWREHDLLCGGWPQTEFAVLSGANIFMQKRHVGSESGCAIYTGSGKKVWELWRQVIFLVLLSNLLVPNSACFSGLRKRVP